MGTPEAVTAVIADMVLAINGGDIAKAMTAFSSHPLIIEDIAPYRWEGPDAVGQWLNAMGENARKLGISAIVMTLGAPLQVQVEDGRAYAAYAARLGLTMAASTATAEGHLGFTLAQRHGDWKIESLVWSGPQPR